MANDKKKLRKHLRELRAAQDEHAALLKKLEKARAQLDKRTRQLQQVEARIAELQQLGFNPDAAELGHAPDGSAPLRDALLIYNPKSGGASRNEQLERIVETLRAHGVRADIGLKTSGKAARELARAAAERGADLVIVAGGDGTVEEVASQLVNSSTRLAIIPIGTMNNLARVLGVPLDLEAACALIGMGVTRLVDIGQVQAGEKPQIEYFMETAGAGLSGILLPAGQKAKKGRWADLQEALGRFFTAQPASVTVYLDDDQVIQAKTHLVTVSNAPLIAKNNLIAPDAKVDDGLLDVAVYADMSKADLIGHFVANADGKRDDNPKIQFYRAAHVRIESDIPLDVSSDKDGIPGKPMWDIRVVPGALSMVVGNGIGLTMPFKAAPAAPPLTGDQPPEPIPETADGG